MQPAGIRHAEPLQTEGEDHEHDRRRQRDPSQAATAPGNPARKMPMATPTWLLVGPGRS